MRPPLLIFFQDNIIIRQCLKIARTIDQGEDLGAWETLWKIKVGLFIFNGMLDASLNQHEVNALNKTDLPLIGFN